MLMPVQRRAEMTMHLKLRPVLGHRTAADFVVYELKVSDGIEMWTTRSFILAGH
jgi:hypothetical protein